MFQKHRGILWPGHQVVHLDTQEFLRSAAVNAGYFDIVVQAYQGGRAVQSLKHCARRETMGNHWKPHREEAIYMRDTSLMFVSFMKLALASTQRSSCCPSPEMPGHPVPLQRREARALPLERCHWLLRSIAPGGAIWCLGKAILKISWTFLKWKRILHGK